MKNLFVALMLMATPAAAEQYLGPNGGQGAASGFAYTGSFVGYFTTRPMADAFTVARRMSMYGIPTYAVAKKDAAGRTVGWTIGSKYYAMAYGPIQVSYMRYYHSGYVNPAYNPIAPSGCYSCTSMPPADPYDPNYH